MDEIRIGDLITLGGRTFTVRGFDPMSLPEQMVELVDTATGDDVRVPLERLDAKGAGTQWSTARERSQEAVRRGRGWRC